MSKIPNDLIELEGLQLPVPHTVLKSDYVRTEKKISEDFCSDGSLMLLPLSTRGTCSSQSLEEMTLRLAYDYRWNIATGNVLWRVLECMGL